MKISAYRMETRKFEEATPKYMVWYSPKWNELSIATIESGFIFRNEYGDFQKRYKTTGRFSIADFYYIGKL